VVHVPDCPNPVPPEIRARFEVELGKSLPDPLLLDIVVSLYREVAETVAEEKSVRGIYQVRAGYDGAYFIDRYYEIQSPTFFSSHRRIHQDGRQERLECLEVPRYFPEATDAGKEDERVAEHNAEVLRALRAKGFGL
jgi:hypothetical protein